MIRIYRTEQPEAAAKALAETYGRAVVRAAYWTAKPIRFRADELEPIQVFFLKPSAAANGQLDAWLKAESGILINFRKTAFTVKHKVQVLAECPMSMEMLNDYTLGAREFAVVRKPPNWDAHRVAAERAFPTSERCKELHETILRCSLTPDEKKIISACGIDPEGIVSMSDNELSEALSIDWRDINPLRRRMIGMVSSRNYKAVQPLIPRVPPRDKGAMDLYRVIEKLPEVGGVRLALGSVLSKETAGWRNQLRKLVSTGSVEKKQRLGFYRIGAIKPDYARIDRDRATALTSLEALIQEVDQAQEFQPQRAAVPA